MNPRRIWLWLTRWIRAREREACIWEIECVATEIRGADPKTDRLLRGLIKSLAKRD